LVSTPDADDLLDGIAVGEADRRRDVAHPVCCGESTVAVDVDLGDGRRGFDHEGFDEPFGHRTGPHHSA
jgi:hypothetical protein